MDEIRVDLIPDLDEVIGKHDHVQAAAKEAAEATAAHARSLAPVRSGRYARSISVERTRRGWRVVSSDPIAAHVEFGVPSRGIRAHFVFRRAAKAVGLKFKRRG